MNNYYTILAIDCQMEHREGFEPPVLRICNPVHWATLPPVRCLVPLTRIELVIIAYQATVIPFNYKGVECILLLFAL